MSDTPPQRPASGSVPHTFRLRLARWVPRMPLALRRQKAFLFALSTVAAMADTAGRTRWHADENRPGRPLRLKELAAAMGSDDKDARRYLTAGIAAGVLRTEAPPSRGRTTVYVLNPLPYDPHWAAALAVLTAGGADTRTAEPRTVENGGASPVLDAPAGHPSSGDASLNSARGERGTVPPLSSGDGSPMRTGDGPPNITRGTHEHPHEMVAVGPQVRDARGHDHHERAGEPDPAGPQPLRSVPPPAPGSRTGGRPARTPEGQPPLLLPVPAPTRPAESPAHAPAADEPHDTPYGPPGGAQAFGPPRMPWRALVANARPDDAARVYRDRWTGDAATYLPDPTGT